MTAEGGGRDPRRGPARRALPTLDAVYVCPHGGTPAPRVECNKPAPGMLLPPRRRPRHRPGPQLADRRPVGSTWRRRWPPACVPVLLEHPHSLGGTSAGHSPSDFARLCWLDPGRLRGPRAVQAADHVGAERREGRVGRRTGPRPQEASGEAVRRQREPGRIEQALAGFASRGHRRTRRSSRKERSATTATTSATSSLLVTKARPSRCRSRSRCSPPTATRWSARPRSSSHDFGDYAAHDQGPGRLGRAAASSHALSKRGIAVNATCGMAFNQAVMAAERRRPLHLAVLWPHPRRRLRRHPCGRDVRAVPWTARAAAARSSSGRSAT